MTPQPPFARAVPGVAAVLLVAAACGRPGSLPVEQRTYISRDSGYRYVIPPDWKVLRGEVRSPHGILISIQVLDLEGGDEKFVRGLPGTIRPQLEAWARHFFGVVGAPAERPFTLDGRPGLEVRYPVRIRPTDPEATVAYWVVRNDRHFYVLRASIPAVAATDDAGGLAEFLAAWQFTGPSGGGSDAPPGSFQLEVPQPPPGAASQATPRP